MSCLIEKDPRDTGIIALIISIVWYKPITVEQALRLAQGQSRMKPGVKLTPELMARVKMIMKNPGFKNFAYTEKSFRIDRRDIFDALKKERNLGNGQ